LGPSIEHRPTAIETPDRDAGALCGA